MLSFFLIKYLKRVHQVLSHLRCTYLCTSFRNRTKRITTWDSAGWMRNRTRTSETSRRASLETGAQEVLGGKSQGHITDWNLSSTQGRHQHLRSKPEKRRNYGSSEQGHHCMSREGSSGRLHRSRMIRTHASEIGEQAVRPQEWSNLCSQQTWLKETKMPGARQVSWGKEVGSMYPQATSVQLPDIKSSKVGHVGPSIRCHTLIWRTWVYLKCRVFEKQMDSWECSLGHGIS